MRKVKPAKPKPKANSNSRPNSKKRNPGRPRGESLSSPRRIDAKIRLAQAIELRKSGASYERIVEAGFYSSAKVASNEIMGALRALVEEPAEELRRLEEARLDALFLGVYPAARKGALGAIDRCLAIMARRARLRGLDAPTLLQFDWRAEAERAGVDPATAAKLFEQVVSHWMKLLPPPAPDTGEVLDAKFAEVVDTEGA